jgi:hypothetical protein
MGAIVLGLVDAASLRAMNVSTALTKQERDNLNVGSA